MCKTLHHLRCLKLCKWFILSSCADFFLSTVAFEMTWNAFNQTLHFFSCKQVTDHRVEGTTHTAMFQSSSPCTWTRWGKKGVCELWVESVELLRLHSLHVWFGIWKSNGSRSVSSESSRWDASMSCFLGHILRFQHISNVDFHLTHYSR